MTLGLPSDPVAPRRGRPLRTAPTAAVTTTVPSQPEAPGVPGGPANRYADYLARVQRIDLYLKAGRSALEKLDFSKALAGFRLVEREQKGDQNIEALIADTLVKQRAAFDKAMEDGQKNEEAGRLLVARQWYQRAAYYDPRIRHRPHERCAVDERFTEGVDPPLQPGVV